MMAYPVIFSDLDGTLVDENYSYERAGEALAKVKERRIPLVFCTSKTRAEIEVYRKELGIADPFISENGGAIFIPAGYFGKVAAEKRSGGYEVIELGTSYSRLREVLASAMDTSGAEIRGFGDMTAEEVAGDSGLSVSAAKLAKRREYDEPFKLAGTPEQQKKALEHIEKAGLRHTEGGRYHHILGDNDKGKAVKMLSQLYSEKYGGIESFGFGDAENDFSMLENVDHPVLIRKANGSYAAFPGKAVRSDLPGPAGWNEKVSEMLF